MNSSRHSRSVEKYVLPGSGERSSSATLVGRASARVVASCGGGAASKQGRGGGGGRRAVVAAGARLDHEGPRQLVVQPLLVVVERDVYLRQRQQRPHRQQQRDRGIGGILAEQREVESPGRNHHPRCPHEGPADSEAAAVERAHHVEMEG